MLNRRHWQVLLPDFHGYNRQFLHISLELLIRICRSSNHHHRRLGTDMIVHRKPSFIDLFVQPCSAFILYMREKWMLYPNSHRLPNVDPLLHTPPLPPPTSTSYILIMYYSTQLQMLQDLLGEYHEIVCSNYPIIFLRQKFTSFTIIGDRKTQTRKAKTEVIFFVDTTKAKWSANTDTQHHQEQHG